MHCCTRGLEFDDTVSLLGLRRAEEQRQPPPTLTAGFKDFERNKGPFDKRPSDALKMDLQLLTDEVSVRIKDVFDGVIEGRHW